jgi:hypothetical protein
MLLTPISMPFFAFLASALLDFVLDNLAAEDALALISDLRCQAGSGCRFVAVLVDIDRRPL